MPRSLSLLLGTAAMFTALSVVFLELLDHRAADAPQDGEAHEDGSARRLAERISAMAERTMTTHGWQSTLTRALEQAGFSIRPGDLCLVTGIGAAGGALVGTALGGPTLGFLFVLLAPGVAWFVVNQRRDTRRKAFGEQVVVLLPSLAASLRAGHSLSQSIELSSRELDAPAGDELRRVTAEVQLGRDQVEALTAMADRFDSDDLRWLISAIQVHREVGGDLTRVLDRVADTIRARDHLKRQVRTLTAEGRASAKVLTFLPLLAGAVMSATNPTYVDAFTGSSGGRVMLGIAVGLMALGAVWLRSITRLEVG